MLMTYLDKENIICDKINKLITKRHEYYFRKRK